MFEKIWEQPRVQELIRFVANGAASFLVDYAILYTLTEFCGLYYLLSAAISFMVSVFVNYIICKRWVFKINGKQSKKAILLFIGSSVIGLILNQLIMWFLVDQLGVYYMGSKIVSTGIVMIWNYIMKRKSIYMDKALK